MAELVGTSELEPSEGLLATERQQQAAKEALACVNEGLEALELGMTLDAVTVSIEGAVQALLELTGRAGKRGGGGSGVPPVLRGKVNRESRNRE